MLTNAAQNSNKAMTCVIGVGGASWIAYGQLASQTVGNYCSDSSGFSGTIPSDPVAIDPGVNVSCR